MNKIILSLIISIFFTKIAIAENYSMRECMLLPITDTAGNSLGYKVYEDIERKLKSDGWCEYQSSSEVIGIFSKYRERLGDYLKDPNVLKTVADRLKVGTMIRISLQYELDTIEVSVDVIGENGEDVYLSEKTILNEINKDLIVTTVQNWLELYETSIPYDGKVLGVLGDQITFTSPRSKKTAIGQDFVVRRIISKKRHPLLKKVVEWDSLMLAAGKIFNISRGQSLGTIKSYTTDKRVEVGDWIKLEKYVPSKFDSTRYKIDESDSFGKLGELSLSIALSSHTLATSPSGGSVKMGGYTYGVSAETEAWITRQYYVMGEFSKNIGNLSKQSGSPDSDSAGQNYGVLKLGGGYKYLPMGFFYGPQVNFYTGWVKYSYNVEESETDGFGENSISGFLLGIGGSLPLKREIRVFGSGEVLPFGEFEDSSGIYGSTKSVSSLNLKAGVHYLWSPSIKLLGVFNVINNSAKVGGNPSEVSYSDTMLKFGGVFTY